MSSFSATPQKEGCLLKLSVSKPTANKYTRRYFVVLNGALVYYAEIFERMYKSDGLLSCKPKFYLPLHGCKVTMTPKSETAFTIEQGGLVLSLVAATESERTSWVTALWSASENTATATVSPQSAGPTASASSRPSRRTPKVGDHVVSLHKPTGCFYMSTIVSFNSSTQEFTVDWDDKDPTGREMEYKYVTLDVAPEEDEIAVGSVVVFPKGKYSGTEGKNEGGMRYLQGQVKDIRVVDGVKLYDGVSMDMPPDVRKFYADPISFFGLRRDELRMSPNVLDLMVSRQQPTTRREAKFYDIFLSYNKLDSLDALMNNEVSDAPPSYGQLVQEASDPRRIKAMLVEAGFSVWLDIDQPPGVSYADVVEAMTNSTIIVACVSNAFVQNDDHRMQFQFARKTLNKPIIPLVVERYETGPPWRWQVSAVGLLLAGELYIDFTNVGMEAVKFDELVASIQSKLDNGSTPAGPSASFAKPTASTAKQEETTDVFVSYCWSNSTIAFKEGQVKKVVGTPFNDPRFIAQTLRDHGLNVWLDVQKLQSGSGAASMFEQIASGLRNTSVVVACISSEYANSENCRMEFQFAAKSLKKPIVPVICGEGDEWRMTAVGMLVASLQTINFEMQALTSKDDFDSLQGKLLKEVAVKSKTKAVKRAAVTVPKPNDHVIAFHENTGCYYMATVESFDRKKLTYTVNWDDKDTTGREMRFDRIALDTQPKAEDIGVGTLVVFPQGRYVLTQGSTTGGYRYHQGVITAVRHNSAGELVYDGHHSADRNSMVQFRDYSFEFTEMPLSSLRLSPNAIDALEAF